MRLCARIDEFLRGGLPLANESIRLSFPDAIDAALAMGDLDEAERLVKLLEEQPPGEIPPFLQAQILRVRSLLAAAKGGSDGVETGLLAAATGFSELGYTYWTACAQLGLAEWLSREGRTDEAERLADETADSFERLGTQPMLAPCSSPAQVRRDAVGEWPGVAHAWLIAALVASTSTE